MTNTPTGNKAARARMLASIRSGLAVTGQESDRRAAVAQRLAAHSRNLIPARARQSKADLLRIFRAYLEGQSADVVELPGPEEIPTAIASYLRGKNLALSLRMGDDPLWERLPWDKEPALQRAKGRAVGTDTAGLSHAIAGIAETGTLVFMSGPDNPTTLNYVPESHLIVVREADIAGAYEEMWTELRGTYGEGQMPRAVNFISGPSRTADIEQQLVMGAHGPRRLLVMIIKDA
jgi:L-lactate dehydrogenase complex protein LldG